MTKQITPQQALRFNRQIVLPSFDLDGQEALLNASVLIIGMGGLGCACAQFLVASGVGSLTLVDDDEVEITNLQRQVLHTESDLGISKCESAKQSLQALNSEVVIRTVQTRLKQEALVKEVEAHTLVVDCTDNLDSRKQINQACYQSKTPLVSGAAIRLEGQVCSFSYSDGEPCYDCLSALFGAQELSCVEAGVLSPVVGIVGSMQALEVLHLLTQQEINLNRRLMLFDGQRMQWREFTIPKNPRCPTCQPT